jgi:hypothetical protein
MVVLPSSVMNSRRLTGYPSSTASYPTMLTVHGASRQIWITDVRFGSKADIGSARFDIRFTPESGHSAARS